MSVRPQPLRSSAESAERFFAARERSKATARLRTNALDEFVCLRETMISTIAVNRLPMTAARIFAATLETYGRCPPHRLRTTLRYLVRAGDVLQDRYGYRVRPPAQAAATRR